MSSSIDYFECPKCGADTAFRDQDNRTGEVVFGCPKCEWNGEPAEKKVLKQYCKFVSGYVAQQYIRKGTRFVCISQNFVAWDHETSRENEAGEVIFIDTTKEVEFPFGMIQPKSNSV
jgi:transposase-like protein